MEATDLEAGLVALAKERCEAVRVEVRSLGVDPGRFAGPGRATWEGDPCRAHPTVELWWTVAGGTDRYTVRPELALWVEAPVAAQAVSAGQVVPEATGVVSLSSLAGRAWAGGRAVARHDLTAGAPLTSWSVAPAPDVSAGTWVLLRVRVGALEIRSEGRLLGDARVGERVRVWAAATDAALSGVLSDRQVVDL